MVQSALSSPNLSCRCMKVIGCALMFAALTQTGCFSLKLSLDDARTIATVASWTGENRVQIREKRTNDFWEKARIAFGYGPQPSPQARLYLRRFDVEPNLRRTKLDALRQLKILAEREPDLNKEFAISELAHQEARVNHKMGRKKKAKIWYVASVYHAYRYLFSHDFDNERNAYAPEFRMTVDYYNQSLENLLRILKDENGLKPDTDHQIAVDNWTASFRITLRGPWNAGEFEKFEFANDFEIKGIGNKHRREGLGVPLIAVRTRDTSRSPIDKYYPAGLALPVTAFLRFSDASCRVGTANVQHIQCAVEFHDSLRTRNVMVGNRYAPLESDITTPLAYFLQDPLMSTQVLETLGLLQGDLLQEVRGLYMLEPYDPNRVPVVLVHGLWSGPFTWLEMFNELRALPEIREHYQFWFYLYPTGQPFWLSAKQMRQDLAQMRQDLDPQHRILTLDEMVLVGHSMGGLMARLQTVESGDEFWRILSDRPFEQLQADDQTREEIREMLFFHANPSVKRVITIGTPHHGSKFANNFTRWLGHKFIKLPDVINGSVMQKIRNRDDIIRNREILTTKTSIDSLAADSPFLEKLQNSRSAPWVKVHNIIGNVEKRKYLGIAGEFEPTDSDGIVSTQSARFDAAVSNIEVNARHQDIHLQPRTILEVRRILLEHTRDVQREFARRAGNQRASYQQEVGESAMPEPTLSPRLPNPNEPVPEIPVPRVNRQN